MNKPYGEEFYKGRQDESLRSAEVVIPLVLNLISPKSVIDIGCGTGSWLSVFKKYGIEDVLGVDGEWVDKKMLKIPEDRFISHNLEEPVKMDRQFDLAISLEVAEHIPPENASNFIESLAGLAPVILFSAAIPLQVGRHHVNEQWPEYWAKHFAENGYSAIDPIRKKIWQNNDVQYWYAQNILIFVRRDYLETQPTLKREEEGTSRTQLSMVHPKMYMLNSVPIRILLHMPLLNTIFLNIITGKIVRNFIRKHFL